MLEKKYIYDKKPAVHLDELQLKYKKIMEDKIESGEYEFESVNCVVCGNRDFEPLSEKDRFGLYMPVVICKTCGLIQTNPRMNQESYNQFYDLEYRELAEGENRTPANRFSSQKNRGEKIFDFVEKNLEKPFKNKFVVEIGTGAGGILQAFKEKGNTVFGVDLGSEYINYGKNRGLDLKVGGIAEVEKLSAKPDLIIYNHTLEHILNPIEELKKIRDMLAQSGAVYIEVPGIKNLDDSYKYRDFLKYLQCAHVYHFSLKTLKNVACKAGLSFINGDEQARSLFKIGEIEDGFENDFQEAYGFLKKLEKRRRGPFNPYIIKYKVSRIKRSIHSLLFRIFKKTKTLESMRKIKHAIKRD